MSDLRALAERTLYLESSRMTMPTPGDAAILAESAPVLARAVLSLSTSLEAAERRAEKAEAALRVAVDGLRRVHGRLVCGKVDELEDEVDEAIHTMGQTLETLRILDGREEKE